MQSRYLLYIDILGFRDLVNHNPASISELFSIVDSLNVHRHDAFKTIVFSDTILVYNKDNVLRNSHEHHYIVMYACEFAQDLMYRFIGTPFSFRAVLRYGEFDHYKLKHIDCFYGEVLIGAYDQEKKIQSVGLFIDNEAQKYNNIFPTAHYDDELSYVFLNQATEDFEQSYGYSLPLDKEMAGILLSTGNESLLLRDIILLREIYERSQSQGLMPSARLKYQTAWTYQISRYPNTMQLLVQSEFDPQCLTKEINWTKVAPI